MLVERPTCGCCCAPSPGAGPPPGGDPRQPHLRSTSESRPRASYAGARRKKGCKIHIAADTLGHPFAAHVTTAASRIAQTVEPAKQVVGLGMVADYRAPVVAS
jgi:hypothetical protein